MKSLTSQHKTANAFAGTFAFLPTLEPTQKKQKSQQANAQRQCKLDTAEDRPEEAQQVTSVAVAQPPIRDRLLAVEQK
jgi:hypothetical protein